jgi:hypothetical protein
MDYRFKSTKFHPDRELKQEGVEARCHELDNLRYLAVAQLHYSRTLES